MGMGGVDPMISGIPGRYAAVNGPGADVRNAISNYAYAKPWYAIVKRSAYQLIDPHDTGTE